MAVMRLLRAAALIAFVQGAGHALAVATWAPKRGPREVAVVEAMKSQDFVFQGLARSYWDFFFGYGLFAAFNCLVEAVLFWQLAALIGKAPAQGRSILVLFLAANLVYAGLSLRYFFFTPMVLDVAIASCLGLALVQPWPPLPHEV
jgi:hypothetical protein